MDFIRNNLLLVAIAVVSGVMLIWPSLRRSGGSASLDTLAATRLINAEDALVLDIREHNEFREGHVLGARNVPAARLGEAAGSELARYKERAVIVYCAVGQRSAGAADTLRKAGFSKVYNLSGGIAAWRQAGLPVEK
jgi:rhodanese-related sulfurtransferase